MIKLTNILVNIIVSFSLPIDNYAPFFSKCSPDCNELKKVHWPYILVPLSITWPRLCRACLDKNIHFSLTQQSLVRTLSWQKHTFQSHSAEPGPEFVLTKFDLSGHSPLVEFCLREQKLAKDVGVSRLLSRKVEFDCFSFLNISFSWWLDFIPN